VNTPGPSSAPPSVLERLLELNPETEIWWDSSPLVFESWRQRQLAAAPAAVRPVLAAQLARLFDDARPARSVFSGVTTNPPLSLQAIEGRPDLFAPLIRRLATEQPHAHAEVFYWQTYLAVVQAGAARLRPLWEATRGRRGYLSGQVDPRYVTDTELMFRQGLEIAAQGPNVMVKCPGTAEGIEVIRRLTALGIATNCTLSFIVPQFAAVAAAIERGLAAAHAARVDLFRWRSVITQMAARFEERPEFDASAAAAGVALSATDKRWASVALFHRARTVLAARGYPGKMLLCSLRRGPVDAAGEHYWHVEKTAGHAMVYTCPPECVSELFALDGQLELRVTPDDVVPADVLTRLQRVPYFAEAWATDLPAERFATLPASQFTRRQFSEATEKTVACVRRLATADR
jgi:transaldolase